MNIADVDIVFVGKDNSLISQAKYKIEKIYNRNPPENNLGKLGIQEETDFIEISRDNPPTLLKVLEKILEQLNNDNKLLNQINFREKEDYKKKKIYAPNPYTPNELYFCNLVGVVADEIDINCNELAEDSNPDNEQMEKATIHFNYRLQIQSRFDDGKPYFLATMLLGNKLDLNEKNIPNSEDEIFDYLLLFWFKEQFQNAYMKGFYRTYRRFEKNDDHLRGTIDIARHIKLNMGQNNGKIAYSYRENTVNNFLNHLIIAAYEHLKRKYSALVMEIFDQDLDLKTAMNTLKNEIGYVDTAEQTLLFKNMKPISHPYYMEYEALRVTCMKILRDTGISFFDGDSEETSHGILFYIPDLWEMYLEREVFQKDFFNQNDSENTVDADSQKEFDGAIAFDNQGEIGIFYNIYNGEKGGFSYKSRPDYIIKYNTGRDGKNQETPFMILDAKFKPKWFDVHKGKNKGDNLGYLSEDYDKCIRDMVSICGHATGTIFPVKECEKLSPEKLNEIWAHSISEYNPLDRFYTIPVFIPSSTITGDTTSGENTDKEYKDYSEWKNELETNIQPVKNELKVVFHTEWRVFLEIRTNPSQTIRNDKNFIYKNDAHKE